MLFGVAPSPNLAPLHPTLCSPLPEPRCSDATASWHQHDLAVCTLTSGLMVDVSISGATLRVDQGRNRRAYGREVSASQLLRGEVPSPPAAVRLAAKLCQAESHVVAAAFEPSHAGSEGEW